MFENKGDDQLCINYTTDQPICFHYIKSAIPTDFKLLSYFSMKLLLANRIAPDGMPHSVASHLGLCCLLMSHKRTAGLNELTPCMQVTMHTNDTGDQVLQMHVKQLIRNVL